MVQVELVVVEVEQVDADGVEAALPVGLHEQPDAEVVPVDHVRGVSTGEQSRRQIARIRDRRHDRRAVAVPLSSRQRQQDLDHVGVGVRHRRGHDDDRSRSLQADQIDIGGLERIAPAADDPGVAGVAKPLPDHLLHLDPVQIGKDGHARTAFALVRLDQLGEHDEHLVGPAEQHGVVALDDPRSALAEQGEPNLQAGSQHADQGADDEDATQGDEEHQQQIGRAALVAAHRAGIHGAQQTQQDLTSSKKDADNTNCRALTPAPRRPTTASFLSKLNLNQLTRIVAAVGVVGLVLAIAGIIGIRRARRRRREEEDEYDDDYYDDRPGRGGGAVVAVGRAHDEAAYDDQDGYAQQHGYGGRPATEPGR